MFQVFNNTTVLQDCYCNITFHKTVISNSVHRKLVSKYIIYGINIFKFSEKYLLVLLNKVILAVGSVPYLDHKKIWLQHDGCPVHSIVQLACTILIVSRIQYLVTTKVL